MLSPLVVLLMSVALHPDTAVVLGTAQRDVTGDGIPETLRVVGVGPSMDSLDVTFTIESHGRVVYRIAMVPLTRSIGFDAGRRRLTEAEHRARIRDFGRWFFDAKKFKDPSTFVTEWRDMAPGRLAEIPAVIARDGKFAADSARGAAIWSAMQRNSTTIFEFSPGGDAVFAIAWHAADKRFYKLVECC